jgi:hypothetical protein
MVQMKYIYPTSLEEWIHFFVNNLHNDSIIWKVVVVAIPLVSNWLIWKIGRGTKVQVRLNPWVGSGVDFILLVHVILNLRSRGISNLS